MSKENRSVSLIEETFLVTLLYSKKCNLNSTFWLRFLPYSRRWDLEIHRCVFGHRRTPLPREKITENEQRDTKGFNERG